MDTPRPLHQFGYFLQPENLWGSKHGTGSENAEFFISKMSNEGLFLEKNAHNPQLFLRGWVIVDGWQKKH
jgi:hypothetical protein